MPVTIAERKFGTRKLGGEQAKREYVIRGAASDIEAKSSFLSSSVPPTTINGFKTVKRKWDVEEIADGIYIGTAIWEPNQLQEKKKQPPGNFRIAFDISGQTVTIKQSKQTIAKYPTGDEGAAPVPDFKGAINVTKDGVEGTDILVPAMTVTIDATKDADDVTEAYIVTLSETVGTVNNGIYKEFVAGTLLLTGVSGTRRWYVDEEANEEYWVYDLSFNFAVSKNATDLSVGSITGIAKKGWEYLWIYYSDEVIGEGENKIIAKVPKYAYVERVYDLSNYSGLGI